MVLTGAAVLGMAMIEMTYPGGSVLSLQMLGLRKLIVTKAMIEMTYPGGSNLSLIAMTHPGGSKLSFDRLADYKMSDGVILKDKYREDLVSYVFPCWAAVTFGLVVLALREPRPRLRRLMTRPGVMACTAAAAALAATGVATYGQFATSTLSGSVWEVSPFSSTWTTTGRQAPAWAIAAAWITLALNRRFRPEPSWLDRAGRLVALGWFVLYLRLLAVPS
jgi:hypothetical protein